MDGKEFPNEDRRRLEDLKKEEKNKKATKTELKKEVEIIKEKIKDHEEAGIILTKFCRNNSYKVN